MPSPGRETGPLGVLGYGMISQPGIRRILELSGHPLVIGVPKRATGVAVWGARSSSHKGAWAARRTGRTLVRVEEAFLRGLVPGRGSRLPPYGLLIDHTGVHYDASRPSDLETLLSTHSLDDPCLLARAEVALGRLTALGLGKYLGHDPAAPLPPENCVVVIDQVYGDASVAASGADRSTFLRMLETARRRFPTHSILVKTHPAAKGARGYLRPEDLRPREIWYPHAIAPAALLNRAAAVFTVSSQLGLDGIWAGHRPVLFGTPVYGGWGLTEDTVPQPRRDRALSRLQLFCALMILAPVWYDPFRDALTEIEAILDIAEAEAQAARDDRPGYTAHGMALWKRRHLKRMFGDRVAYPMIKRDRPETRPALCWASSATMPHAKTVIRIEDGFLRSQGLGARLVPPMSLVADPIGIYYDPGGPSRVEQLIAQSPHLPRHELDRSERLVARIHAEGATKYGRRGQHPDLPTEGDRILVVGQVEDDASIRCGATGAIKTNAALLAAARAAYPAATILFKPHPDVDAGLRPGRLDRASAAPADIILEGADPHWVLTHVDRVWTLTSLMGFEALLRGLPVTCLGAPFYAGWGLTNDLAPVPARRQQVKGVTLIGLAHASLIGAPRYFDPVTRRVCPPEVVLDRLQNRGDDNRGPLLRLAAKAQGAWTSLSPPNRG